jgi:hypothetical protein
MKERTALIPVSEANLVRAAGLSASLGGVLWTVNVIFGQGIGAGSAISVLLAAMPLLLAGGIAGLYLRYDTGSSPGKAGLGQSLAGLALLAGGFITDALGFGVAEQVLSFGLIIFAFGLVLVGFAYLKDEPMPYLNSLPLGVGLLIPLSLVLAPLEPLGLVASAIFGAGWVLLGALLFADAGGTESRQKS